MNILSMSIKQLSTLSKVEKILSTISEVEKNLINVDKLLSMLSKVKKNIHVEKTIIYVIQGWEKYYPRYTKLKKILPTLVKLLSTSSEFEKNIIHVVLSLSTSLKQLSRLSKVKKLLFYVDEHFIHVD